MTPAAAHNLPPRAMLVAGVMSGTSADGVDVAICRISPGRDGVPRIELLAHRGFAYDRRVKAAVLAAARGEPMSAAAFAQLSWQLGALYADCVEATAAAIDRRLQLVACHGQTVFHGADAVPFLGRPTRATWQIGEPAVLAERLRVAVISDLRAADLAAGGQGAPLVPMLDWCLFRHRTRNRLLLNLGGIANITVLPAACTLDQVLAFDTGPANMVVDAVMQQRFGKAFDRNGATAARGRVLPEVLQQLKSTAYFNAPPPKSCGREQFGAPFVARLQSLSAKASAEDQVATATALTVETVLDAYQRFGRTHCEAIASQAKATELFVAGGGAKNRTLLRGLTSRFERLGVSVATTESAGLPVEAKEAVAFALLGWLSWHGLAGNVPSATGASRPVVLGAVTRP